MILAISLLMIGAAFAVAVVFAYCIVRGGLQKPTPAQHPPMDPLTVYLLDRETARIDVEFSLLEREEGWRL